MKKFTKPDEKENGSREKEEGREKYEQYVILYDKPLGKGSEGEVCMAWKRGPLSIEFYAIKITSMVDHHEMHMLMKFRHLKNIIKVEDYFVYRQQAYIVVELCRGGTIARLRENMEIPEHWIAYIINQALQGLVELHNNHAIHRDVKGENILINKHGDIKLADFGVSCCDVRQARHTYVGTKRMLAPEQRKAHEDDEIAYDNRVDVYSLGLVALELAENWLRVDAYTSEVLAANGYIRPLLHKGWSNKFRDFLDKCLAINVEERPWSRDLLDHPFLTISPAQMIETKEEIRAHVEHEAKGDDQLDTTCSDQTCNTSGQPLSEYSTEVRNGTRVVEKEFLFPKPAQLRLFSDHLKIRTSRVYCATYWGRDILVGTRDGLLYQKHKKIYKGKQPRKLINKKYFRQISVISNLGVVLTISGKRKQLGVIQLDGISEGEAKIQNIEIKHEAVEDCCKFTALEFRSGKDVVYYMVAVVRNNLNLFRWDKAQDECFTFISNKTLPTCPVDVMLMKEQNSRLKTLFTTEESVWGIETLKGNRISFGCVYEIAPYKWDKMPIFGETNRFLFNMKDKIVYRKLDAIFALNKKEVKQNLEEVLFVESGALVYRCKENLVDYVRKDFTSDRWFAPGDILCENEGNVLVAERSRFLPWFIPHRIAILDFKR